ncbi:MAG: stage II sporulation protein M [Lachnospiraceae bacterium]|nr:stage II sporulation protein M [Robinsoniella sp.]MDY3766104.1 stage II sporulation protein M [Lachnospiraceae bacterium]
MKKKNMGYLLISFLVGVFFGVVFINVLGNTYIERSGLFSNYFFTQYQNLAVDCDQVFFFVCRKRIRSIAAIWLMGLTSAGIVFAMLYSGYLGYTAGILVMTALLRMGGRGILVAAVSVIPQIFIYGPVMTFLLEEVCEKGQKRRNMRWVYGRREIDWKYGTVLTIALLFFLLGMILESYVSPAVLQYVLKKM